MSYADGAECLQLLVLERVDPAQRMARFYVLSIEPTLFADVSLTRVWGRIGTRGRRRVGLHLTQGAAQIELEKWLQRKRRRGYAVIGQNPAWR
jgi:predicted DNA-binding WGR domain protein